MSVEIRGIVTMPSNPIKIAITVKVTVYAVLIGQSTYTGKFAESVHRVLDRA
jgi:hypothetical protein